MVLLGGKRFCRRCIRSKRNTFCVEQISLEASETGPLNLPGHETATFQVNDNLPRSQQRRQPPNIAYRLERLYRRYDFLLAVRADAGG